MFDSIYHQEMMTQDSNDDVRERFHATLEDAENFGRITALEEEADWHENFRHMERGNLEYLRNDHVGQVIKAVCLFFSDLDRLSF